MESLREKIRELDDEEISLGSHWLFFLPLSLAVIPPSLIGSWIFPPALIGCFSSLCHWLLDFSSRSHWLFFLPLSLALGFCMCAVSSSALSFFPLCHYYYYYYYYYYCYCYYYYYHHHHHHHYYYYYTRFSISLRLFFHGKPPALSLT